MAQARSSGCNVLSIAGTDPSGGAGIQADLKTFTAHACYGMSVVTALVAQNTKGVQGVHPCPPDFVAQQIKAVLDDIDVNAIKTGMLFNTETIRIVVDTLKSHYGSEPIPPIVCDPVCVSTSGHTLLQPDAVEVLISDFFPLATLITPNKSEAELILSTRQLPAKINSLEDMVTAAVHLSELGPKAVLVKGGHLTSTLRDIEVFRNSHPEIKVIKDGFLEENMEILQVVEGELLPSAPAVVDVLRDGDETTLFVRPRLNSQSTHGTGCTLSAAIVCSLSKGRSLVDAVREASAYTHRGIETASPIGKGFGPLNHVHPVAFYTIPKATPSVPNPFIRLLIKSTADVWKSYVEHDFVKQLARGTLRKESFLHFIKQDYLYLKYYARAYGLLAAKFTTFEGIGSATQTILNVITEVKTHKAFCAQWGITEEELESTPESPYTTAYGAYIIDCGLRGDTSKLIMALAACLLGYGEVGLWLKREAAKPGSWVVTTGNPYEKWIEDYSGEGYQAAVKIGIETIEKMAAEDPPSPARLKEWIGVWEKCTKLEKGFWDMGLDLL